MPMIDVYATAGTFTDKHQLAADLAATLMAIEKVPDIPMFRQNTAGFVHELAGLLAAQGDRVTGLIRNPDHAGEVSQAGAAPVVCDLERASVEEIATAIKGADAVVFAAGAGPGSGADRKLTLDRDGAIKLLRAATTAGVPRYLMISGAGVENPPDGDEVFAVYLRAKAEADAALEASDREWTILRPGTLTDDAGTGSVRIGSVPFSGPVPRDDVASVLARLLTDSRSFGSVLYLSSGAQSIEQALDEVLGITGRRES